MIKKMNPNNIAKEELKCENVDEYCKKVMATVRNCQKFSNELQGWHHFSDYPGVNATMKKINGLIKNLVKNIFMHQDIKLNLNGCNSLREKFEVFREGNDALLERVSSDVDDAKGVKRSDIQIVDSSIRTIQMASSNPDSDQMVLLASKNVQKPQLFFEPKIDNSANPFVPPITEKPNSLKPLAVMLCADINQREYYSHPYEYELNHWSPSKGDLALCPAHSPEPRPLSSSPFRLVEDAASLTVMVEDLKKVRQFAVDLEAHSFRSYQGLTCLIQISTPCMDYIVDPFPLRNHLSILNEVFTNPKITKVFHGAHCDILWLQRDFGVYVVNMFDTHQAAIVLEYPHRSLGHLLQIICGVASNKEYQRADWRIRPLPETFIEYARMDTHYLLSICNFLKKELVEKANGQNNLLLAVFDRSTELCLQRYEKPIVAPDSHLDIYRKSRKTFNNRQLFALQQIYQWRDRIARQQDESVDYVLPKHMLLQMAELLPKEIQGIYSCCNPLPPMVKTESLALHQIIREARSMLEDEIIKKLSEVPVQANLPISAQNHHDSAFGGTFIHDLSSIEADPKGLSTLLQPKEPLFGDLFNQSRVSCEFEKKSGLFGCTRKKLSVKRVDRSVVVEEFLSPYKRLVLLKERLVEEPEFAQQPDETKPVIRQPVIPIDIQNLDDQDAARLERLKFHIESVLSGGNYEDEAEPEEDSPSNQDTTKEERSNQTDEDRFKRLQMQINSLIGDTRNSLDSSTSTVEDSGFEVRKKKSKKAEKRKRGQPTSAAKKSKPTPPPQADDLEEGEIQEDETNFEAAQVESFDYEGADFGIFRRERTFKSRGRKFRGSFRNKSVYNPSEMARVDRKTISWSKKQRK